MDTQAESVSESEAPARRSPALLALLKVQEDVVLREPLQNPVEYYLFERYAKDPYGFKRYLYYHAKPYIPRPIQLFLRRRFVAKQSRIDFPSWPIEPILVEGARLSLRNALSDGGVSEVHRIAPWPKGKRFAFCITHDVEWAEGLANAPKLAEIESAVGVRGSWNIVPERYPIDWGIIERLKAEGHELGVQGLKHDGKYYFSRRTFERRAKRIRSYAEKWGAAGFRSPSTLRKPEWIPDLGFYYDSSIPDTDPYEPQPGGCCCIWPFFIRDIVELPMTMPQDHTIFEILGHRDVSVWREKAQWIQSHSGLVLLTVHPDYINTKERLRLYEQFLSDMMQNEDVWHALPFEIAKWWRQRDSSSVRATGIGYEIDGPAADRAGIIRTYVENGCMKDGYLD